MATKEQITVENLIDGAILDGFHAGSRSFLEQLEEQLRTSIVIDESGDAQTLLQSMLDVAESSTNQQLTQEHITDLSDKLSRVLK